MDNCSQTSTVASQYGSKQLSFLDPPGDDKGVFCENISQDTLNPCQESQSVDPQVDEDSEDHELEFTHGARCVEVRCHGELVWKPENENQGRSIRLRRNGDDVEIVDQGTGEVKRIELGNVLYIDIFTFGSKHPNDKSQYDFTSPSDVEGHYIFKKGVRCTEVRGNGLPIWKYRSGNGFPRAVSYFGTRHVSITFSECSYDYKRMGGKWVKEGEEVDVLVETQPQVPEQSTESASVILTQQASLTFQIEEAPVPSKIAPSTEVTDTSVSTDAENSHSKQSDEISSLKSGGDGTDQTSDGSDLGFARSTAGDGQVAEGSALTAQTAREADESAQEACEADADRIGISSLTKEPDSDSLRRGSITYVSDSHVECVFTCTDSGHSSGAAKGSTAGRSSEIVKPKSGFPSLCCCCSKRPNCLLMNWICNSHCFGKEKCAECSTCECISSSDSSCWFSCCSSNSYQIEHDSYNSAAISGPKTIKLIPIELDLKVKDSTETFDCLVKDGFAKFTAKEGYGFSSVKGKTGSSCCCSSYTIWDAKLPTDYATAVVRDDNGTSSSINNVTIFFGNNHRHFVKSDNKFVEDSGVRLFGNDSSNNLTKLAATEYTVVHTDDVFNFTFNQNTKCTEVYFIDRSLVCRNSSKIVSEKVSLWEHDPNERGGIYPKSLVHYTNNNVLVLRFEGLDMTFENTVEGWTFTESGPLAIVFHMPDPKFPNKTVELSCDQFTVTESGDVTIFTIADGVECNKLVYGTVLLWEHDPNLRGGKYPKSLDYDKSKEMLVLKFEGLDLTFAKNTEGQWEYTESYSSGSRITSTPPIMGSTTQQDQPKHDQTSQVTSAVSVSETQKPDYDLLPSELVNKTKDDLVQLVINLFNENKELKTENKNLSSQVIRLMSPSPKKIYPVVLQTTDLMSNEFYVYTKEDNKHIYTAKPGHLFKLVKHYKDILWHTIRRDEFANKVELVDEQKAVIYHSNGTKTQKGLTPYLVTLQMEKHSTHEIIFKKNEKKQIEKYICKPSFLIEAAWIDGQALWPPRSTPDEPYSGPNYTRKIVLNYSKNPPSFRAFYPGCSDDGDDDDENDPDYVTVPNPYIVTGKTFKTEDSSSFSTVSEPTISIFSEIDFDPTIPSSSVPPQESSERPPEIKLFGSDPNDTTKTVELDPSNFELKEPCAERTDFEFKDGVKCTLVVCQGIEVWKHGHFNCNQYPKNVSYRYGTLIVLSFPSITITYEKGTLVKWYGTLDDDDIPQRFKPE
ncbi:hypothetical protein MACK_001089 [Theileria orientalis]|uniref:Uncharacterized protein n=1 Tax=Theileria orientalis TaxID=68886 RepID=A0A976QX42_THEOR|nr:hypothetical protein MACK_001089 [Theileria orientalis]